MFPVFSSLDFERAPETVGGGKRSYADVSTDVSDAALSPPDVSGKRQRVATASGRDILSSLSSSAVVPPPRKRRGETERKGIGDECNGAGVLPSSYVSLLWA